MTTKTDCLDFLSLNLMKTSIWRGVQAERYPADTRNTRAAYLLSDLAEQATDIPDDLWNDIGAHFDPSDRHFYDAVSTASRDVGFRSSPRTFNDFVKCLRAALSVTA